MARRRPEGCWTGCVVAAVLTGVFALVLVQLKWRLVEQLEADGA